MKDIARLVLDTNVIVRGIVNSQSASGKVLSLCDTREAIPLVSLPVIAEYRGTLAQGDLVSRYPELETVKVEKCWRG